MSCTGPLAYNIMLQDLNVTRHKNFEIVPGKSVKEDTKLGIMCNHKFV